MRAVGFPGPSRPPDASGWRICAGAKEVPDTSQTGVFPFLSGAFRTGGWMRILRFEFSRLLGPLRPVCVETKRRVGGGPLIVAQSGQCSQRLQRDVALRGMNGANAIWQRLRYRRTAQSDVRIAHEPAASRDPRYAMPEPPVGLSKAFIFDRVSWSKSMF